MSQEFRLIATLDLKPGSWEKIADVVKECVEQTRKEEGNHFYVANFDQESPNRLIFLETWSSQATLDIHMQTEHFKKLAKTLEAYLEKPMQVVKLTEISV